MSDPHQFVYISYARTDGFPYAQQLADAIHTAGKAVWYDLWQYPPARDGNDYDALLEAQISRAESVVVCLTGGFVDYRMRREIIFAQCQQKPMILVALPDFSPDNMHPLLRHLELLDFRNNTANLDDLLAQIAAPPAFQSPTVANPYRPYLSALYQQIAAFLEATVYRPTEPATGEADGKLPLTFRGKHLKLAPRKVISLDTTEELDMGDLLIMPKSFDNFGDVLAEYGARAFLTGASGSGKTTTLMAFARDAIVRCLENPLEPLPLVASIGGWDAQENTPLVNWLVQSTRYLDYDLVEDAIQNHRALLLLDGLDDLGPTHSETVEVIVADPKTGQPIFLVTKDPSTRKRVEQPQKAHQVRTFDRRLGFLATLEEIGSQNTLVVSVNTATYENLQPRGDFDGIIEIRSLGASEIDAYSRAFPALEQALYDHPQLARFAYSPFMLNVLAHLFTTLTATLSTALAKLPSDEVLAEETLLSHYVQTRFNAVKSQRGHLPFDLAALEYLLGAAMFPFIEESIKNPRPDFAEVNFETLRQLHPEAQELVDIARAMSLLLYVRDDKELYPVYRYAHPALRDYFIVRAGEVALREGNLTQQTRVLRIFCHMGDARAVRSFKLALDNNRLMMTLPNADWEAAVKARALELLGKTHDTRALAPLVTALQDQKGWVRKSAAWGLGELGDEGAIEPLKSSAYRDQDADVRRNAYQALEKLGYDPLTRPIADAF